MNLEEQKKAFADFSKPDEEAGEEEAEAMLGKGENAQTGVLAALFKDEAEAISAYEKSKENFKDDHHALNVIDEIIREEKNHEELLKGLWAGYALPKEKDEPIAETPERADN